MCTSGYSAKQPLFFGLLNHTGRWGCPLLPNLSSVEEKRGTHHPTELCWAHPLSSPLKWGGKRRCDLPNSFEAGQQTLAWPQSHHGVDTGELLALPLADVTMMAGSDGMAVLQSCNCMKWQKCRAVKCRFEAHNIHFTGGHMGKCAPYSTVAFCSRCGESSSCLTYTPLLWHFFAWLELTHILKPQVFCYHL